MICFYLKKDSQYQRMTWRRCNSVIFRFLCSSRVTCWVHTRRGYVVIMISLLWCHNALDYFICWGNVLLKKNYQMPVIDLSVSFGVILENPCDLSRLTLPNSTYMHVLLGIPCVCVCVFNGTISCLAPPCTCSKISQL